MDPRILVHPGLKQTYSIYQTQSLAQVQAVEATALPGTWYLFYWHLLSGIVFVTLWQKVDKDPNPL